MALAVLQHLEKQKKNLLQYVVTTFFTRYCFDISNLFKTTLLHQEIVILDLVVTRMKSNKETHTFVKESMCHHKSKWTCKFNTQNCKTFREWPFSHVSRNKWNEQPVLPVLAILLPGFQAKYIYICKIVFVLFT